MNVRADKLDALAGDVSGSSGNLPDLDRDDACILARLALGESPASIMADLGIEMVEIRRICSLAGAR